MGLVRNAPHVELSISTVADETSLLVIADQQKHAPNTEKSKNFITKAPATMTCLHNRPTGTVDRYEPPQSPSTHKTSVSNLNRCTMQHVMPVDRYRHVPDKPLPLPKKFTPLSEN